MARFSKNRAMVCLGVRWGMRGKGYVGKFVLRGFGVEDTIPPCIGNYGQCLVLALDPLCGFAIVILLTHETFPSFLSAIPGLEIVGQTNASFRNFL